MSDVACNDPTMVEVRSKTALTQHLIENLGGFRVSAAKLSVGGFRVSAAKLSVGLVGESPTVVIPGLAT